MDDKGIWLLDKNGYIIIEDDFNKIAERHKMLKIDESTLVFKKQNNKKNVYTLKAY
jgi:hypothetical protein